MTMPTHYHAVLLKIAVHRLGERRAHVLMHDAAKGGASLRRLLGQALGMEIRVTEEDGIRLISGVDLTLPGWVGRELQLDQTHPETVIIALQGRPVSDVVLKSGADDAIIEMASTRQQGVRLFTIPETFDASTIPLEKHDRLTTWPRMAWRTVSETWMTTWIAPTTREQPDKQTIAAKMALALITAVLASPVVIGLILEAWMKAGWGAGLLVLVFAGLPIAWVTSGAVSEVAIDINTYSTKRKIQ